MNAKPLRVCPACRRPARCRPLPPDGFWQVQVLQRIGMYPYRCEACQVRFFRKVRAVERSLTGAGLRQQARPTEPRREASQTLARSPRRPSRTAPPVDVRQEGLSHDEFRDLIDQIRRREQQPSRQSRSGETDDE